MSVVVQILAEILSLLGQTSASAWVDERIVENDEENLGLLSLTMACPSPSLMISPWYRLILPYGLEAQIICHRTIRIL